MISATCLWLRCWMCLKQTECACVRACVQQVLSVSTAPACELAECMSVLTEGISSTARNKLLWYWSEIWYNCTSLNGVNTTTNTNIFVHFTWFCLLYTWTWNLLKTNDSNNYTANYLAQCCVNTCCVSDVLIALFSSFTCRFFCVVRGVISTFIHYM